MRSSFRTLIWPISFLRDSCSPSFSILSCRLLPRVWSFTLSAAASPCLFLSSSASFCSAPMAPVISLSLCFSFTRSESHSFCFLASSAAMASLCEWATRCRHSGQSSSVITFRAVSSLCSFFVRRELTDWWTALSSFSLDWSADILSMIPLAWSAMSLPWVSFSSTRISFAVRSSSPALLFRKLFPFPLLLGKIRGEALQLLAPLLQCPEDDDGILPDALVLVDVEHPPQDIEELLLLRGEYLLHRLLRRVDRVPVDEVLALAHEILGIAENLEDQGAQFLRRRVFLHTVPDEVAGILHDAVRRLFQHPFDEDVPAVDGKDQLYGALALPVAQQRGARQLRCLDAEERELDGQQYRGLSRADVPGQQHRALREVDRSIGVAADVPQYQALELHEFPLPRHRLSPCSYKIFISPRSRRAEMSEKPIRF